MSDYISRDAAIELLHYNTDERCSAVVSDFEEIPAADVEPVRHGRWIDNGIPDSILSGCSACGFSYGANSFRYCSNCGAKMDLKGGRRQ